MKSDRLLLLLLVISPVFAADTLSLDECLRIGRQNNLNLRRTTIEADMNSPSSLRGWGVYLPSVTASYGINQSAYYTRTAVWPDGSFVILPQAQSGDRRNSSYTIRVDEVLFAGGRNRLAQKSADLSNRLRDVNITSGGLDLGSLITQSYCQAVAAERGLDLAHKVADQRRLQYESAELRLQAGTVIKLDLLQAEIDLGSAVNDSISAAESVKIARNSLNILLNRPLGDDYRLAPLPPLFSPEWDADSLIREATAHHPQFRSLRLNAELQDNNYKAALADYLPTVSADLYQSGSEESGINKNFTFAPRNRFTQFALTASWTLFDRFTRNYTLQEATVRKRQTQVDLLMSEQTLRQNVTERISRLHTLYSQYETALKNGDLALQTLEMEQERYRLGASDMISLGVAQVGYVRAQQSVIAIETDFHTTLAQLESNTGLKLRREP